MAVNTPPSPKWHPRGLNNGLIFGTAYHCVTKLPTALTYGMGDVGAWLAYRLMRSGTAALIDNARAIWPDADDAKLHALALRTYRSYARDNVDFIRALSMTDEQIRAHVNLLNGEPLFEAIRNGTGALTVSPHFGNWELGGVLLRRLTDIPLSVVVSREHSEQVDRRRREFRASLEIETITVREGMDAALRIRAELDRNRIVALLVDRHLGKDRIEVRFFGRRAYFLRTPALLAFFTGAPLIPSFVYRGDDGRFNIDCGPAIHVSRSGNRDENIRAAMQRVADEIERHVSRYPHYWYTFYKFWQSQAD